MESNLVYKFVGVGIIAWILSLLLTITWHMGYSAAAHDLAGQWYEGPEGYCLQQNHPGACANVHTR